MRISLVSAVGVSLCVLAACGIPASPVSRSVKTRSSGAITESLLQHMHVTLGDAKIRTLLTSAGQNFDVQLRGGIYDFPEALHMQSFDRVLLLQKPTAYGDLDGDGHEDIVVVLQIGSGKVSRSELAVIASHSGSVAQLASFTLGHATVQSLVIRNGAVSARVTQWLPQDPGPRTAQLSFLLPQTASAGSGAARR